MYFLNETDFHFYCTDHEGKPMLIGTGVCWDKTALQMFPFLALASLCSILYLYISYQRFIWEEPKNANNFKSVQQSSPVASWTCNGLWSPGWTDGFSPVTPGSSNNETTKTPLFVSTGGDLINCHNMYFKHRQNEWSLNIFSQCSVLQKTFGLKSKHDFHTGCIPFKWKSPDLVQDISFYSVRIPVQRNLWNLSLDQNVFLISCVFHFKSHIPI